jgi:sigma-B regulation protein RsbU (phosphoserine phosphatase)
MYTDGVTDAVNENGELFGPRRLQDVIQRDLKSTPQLICDNTMNNIREFQGNQLQTDDITLVAIRLLE